MPLVAAFRTSLQVISGTASPGLTPRYVLGLSGGLDSRVLLHLCQQAGIDFKVVHIHHGLQAAADEWNRFCSDLCETIDAAYVCIHVDAKQRAGESPEDAARIARYRGLQTQMLPGDILLTAHHEDDQAETLLLQLMRGAGPSGLAAMPVVKPFGSGWHARPLLGVTRDALQAYAEAHHLEWIEDPSNTDTAYDRNFVRHRLMPLLAERWPNTSQILNRAAALQQDALELQDNLAQADLDTLADTQMSLHITTLRAMSRARQLNILRYWIIRSGIEKPRKNILVEIIESVLPAADDAAPLVMWGRAEVRRYRDRLYLMPAISHDELNLQYAWDGETPLLLDALNLELKLEQAEGIGLRQDAVAMGLNVRFRQGGENIQPRGRDHTHSLKKLMQDAGIPPWQRNRIPLIYVGSELACVSGYWVADKFAVEEGHLGWVPMCQELGTRN